MWHFAYQYPAEVAGLVLVDSATEGQMERFPVALKKLQNPDALFPLDTRLPRQTTETFRALTLFNPKQVRALRGELAAIASERPAPLRGLGDLKLVVLSYGYTDFIALEARAALTLLSQQPQTLAQPLNRV